MIIILLSTIILLLILTMSLMIYYYNYGVKLKNDVLESIKRDKNVLENELLEEIKEKNETLESLQKEQDKNKKLLSKQKSSETRLGRISEHLVPFLENCQHDPSNMKFIGEPIDYLSFDYDEGKITFIEVKSGGSKATKRQKLIRNLIQTGRVFYEEIRINQKGVKNKVAENEKEI